MFKKCLGCHFITWNTHISQSPSPQSSPSVENFSKSIKTHYSNNFATIWPSYGKSLLSLFFIEWGTRWDVTKEKLSSRMPGLIHTFIFFVNNFLHNNRSLGMCWKMAQNCAATSVKLSRDENSYLRGRRKTACHSSSWGMRFQYNRIVFITR